MSFRVLEAGLYSILVDAGRLHSRSLGVSVGGAADRTSLTLGNALLGNAAFAVALEISLRGPTLQAQSSIGGVVYGADFALSSDRQPLRTGMTFTLSAGEIVRVGSARHGMRAYLCVVGGFQSPRIVDSRSALEPVVAGCELQCPASTVPHRFLSADAPSSLHTTPVRMLRFLPGAQADWFDASALTERQFIVTPACNRMGMRLMGPALPRPVREMLSEPVCPGTVQVTNDGQCIVLGVDGQTIGGYPRIAHVIRADLDKLGQLRPNDRVQFLPVTLDEAASAWLHHHSELYSWRSRLAALLDCSGILRDAPI